MKAPRPPLPAALALCTLLSAGTRAAADAAPEPSPGSRSLPVSAGPSGATPGVTVDGGRGPAPPPCSAAQISQLEDILQSAPQQPVPEGPRPVPLLPPPSDAAPTLERTCGPLEAQRVSALLASCLPQPTQAVALLGAGRCQQQAGRSSDAARLYREYLQQADPVSPERRAARRARVTRWLEELGEPPAQTATLVLTSNLRGVVVKELAGYALGLVIDRGTSRIAQPSGPRRLRLLAPGFDLAEVPVTLSDERDVSVAVDFRPLLLPAHRALLPRWDDFVASGLTPDGYESQRRRPITVALSLLVLAGGSALIGVCAANVNNACDAGWKQGVAYGAGAVIGVAGLVATLGSLLMAPQAMPVPGAVREGLHGPARVYY